MFWHVITNCADHDGQWEVWSAPMSAWDALLVAIAHVQNNADLMEFRFRSASSSYQASYPFWQWHAAFV